MALREPCAHMYQIRYSISIKVKGLNAANNTRKLSSSYQSYRDLTEVEDTALSPDLTEGNDFSAIDFCKAKRLL